MNKKMFEEKILKCSHTDQATFQDEWYIVFSENTKINHSCICGHHVKRITYIYNKFTKHIMRVGSTCAKKFGINQHLKNSILLLTIKHMISLPHSYTDDSGIINIANLSKILKEYINLKYLDFQEKIKICIMNDIDIDYYDTVLPFRRLLNDVCYLVTEYNYDFMVLLKEIESNVNAMNNTFKHMIIDETVSVEEEGEEQEEEEAKEEGEEAKREQKEGEQKEGEQKEGEPEEGEPEEGEQKEGEPEEGEPEEPEEEEGEAEAEAEAAEQEEVPFRIIDIVSTEDDVKQDVYKINIINEDIKVDNIYILDNNVNEPIELCMIEHSQITPTIQYEIPDVFICDFCNEDFINIDEYNMHENICRSTNTIVYDNVPVEACIEEESVHTTKLKAYIAQTKCESCINHMTPYCYCERRYRVRRLAMDIMDLKKDMFDFSLRAKELYKNTILFGEKIEASLAKYGISHKKYEYITV